MLLLVLADFAFTFVVDLIATLFVTAIVYPENVIIPKKPNYRGLVKPLQLA